MAVMHDALDRHIQPGSQPRNVVCVRFAGPILDPRQGRSGHAGFFSYITQAQALLLAPPSHRPTQLRRIDSCFLYHAAKLTTLQF